MPHEHWVPKEAIEIFRKKKTILPHFNALILITIHKMDPYENKIIWKVQKSETPPNRFFGGPKYVLPIPNGK